MTAATGKRVLVSQRQDRLEGRDETRDGVDVRFAPILWDMGFVPVPMANMVPDAAAYVAALAPAAILLTGGNDIGTAPQRDDTDGAMLAYAARHRLPVFAVCRGLQFMNHYQGGQAVPVTGHVATRHRIQGPLAPQGRQVNSYHGQAIPADGLGRDLVPLAICDAGHIEAARHATLPWVGVMWHPERDTPPDPKDITLMRLCLTGAEPFVDGPESGDPL